MARVFVSYRRADGAYGVGWIAERLRSLDLINGVQTAFHDVALRAGDDFPEALNAEIESSDLMVAVIGPHWLGESKNGAARIQDEDDWIVREIDAAFQSDTRVMPVLMTGAEHPLASQLHPSIAELARLHAIPFGDDRDLDVIVQQVESHLSEIDQERARRAGLEQPIEVERLEHPMRLAALATLFALVGCGLGWLAGATDMVAEKPAASMLQVLFPILGAAAFGASVLGVALYLRLVNVAVVQWKLLGALHAFGLGASALALLSSFGGFHVGRLPVLYAFVVGAMVNLPWGFALSFPGTARPRALDDALGDRVRYLGVAAEAVRWSVIHHSLVLATAGALVAAMVHDPDTPTNLLLMFTLVVLLTIMLMGLYTWNVAKLGEQRAALDIELGKLPPRYRRNATRRLELSTLGEWGWKLWACFALPTVVVAVACLALHLG